MIETHKVLTISMTTTYIFEQISEIILGHYVEKIGYENLAIFPIPEKF